jgi:tetratricopeptide (TPR) repeat protein
LLIIAGLVAGPLLPSTTFAQQPQGQQPQGQQRRAPDQGRQAGPRGPQAPTVWGFYIGAQIAERGRDFDSAHDLIEQALRREPNDPDLAQTAFRLRLLVGKVTAAADLAQRRLGNDSTSGLANLAIGVAALKRGDMKAAETSLLRLTQDVDLGLLRPYATAWLRAGQRDFAAARSQLELARPKEGEKFLAPHLVVAASIDEMAGDRAEAEKKLRKALELDSDGMRTVLSVAGFLKRNGKAAEARELLRTYNSQHSDSIGMDALIASDAAPKLPTAADGIADLLFDLAGAIASVQREGASEMALVYARMALELKPDLDVARLLVAELLENMDQNAKAIEMYQSIDALSPLQWRARLRAAALLADNARLDEALRILRTMVNDRPERYDAAAALGDMLRSKERYEEAATAYDTAISRIKQLDKRHWPLLYARGIVEERTKQWDKAEADFNKALELEPDQAYVLNYLGYSWIDRGMNLDKGMKLLLRANELKTNDGAITDSVGWAYYRLGQYDKAVEWLEKAIELKADDATIVEHLGDAYWQVGRRREARFQWERALRQKPEQDRIEPIKAKLSDGLKAEAPSGTKQ